MERRSRSAVRGNYGESSNGVGVGLASRQSSGRGFAPPSGLARRPGGDSRTLSPDRRNGQIGGYASGRGGSYNPYVDRAPLPAGPASLGPAPPPTATTATLPSSASAATSTPQSTPTVRYEDFAEDLRRRASVSPPKPAAVRIGILSGTLGSHALRALTRGPAGACRSRRASFAAGKAGPCRSSASRRSNQQKLSLALLSHLPPRDEGAYSIQYTRVLGKARQGFWQSADSAICIAAGSFGRGRVHFDRQREPDFTAVSPPRAGVGAHERLDRGMVKSISP